MIDTPYTSIQQSDDFGLTFSNEIQSARLAASTDTALNISGSARRYKAVVRVEAEANVFVSLNKAASAPVGASFANTGVVIVNHQSEFCREVRNTDVLHFFTEVADVDVTVEFYKIEG